jgi:hypothetical protein
VDQLVDKKTLIPVMPVHHPATILEHTPHPHHHKKKFHSPPKKKTNFTALAVLQEDTKMSAGTSDYRFSLY